MKLQELLNVMIDTQAVKVVNAKNKEEVIYEGIKAGCMGGFSQSAIQKVKVEGNIMIIETNYEMSDIMSASDEDLFDMYFDESDLNFDLNDLEKKMFRLSGELNDIIGDL